MAAGYRRRNRIGPGANPDEEIAAARDAGLSDDDIATAAAFAHAHNGDLERAASALSGLVAEEPLWRTAFERYEALGVLPAGVVARLVPDTIGP